MHIELDDDVVRQVDAFAGDRGRSRFVREAVLAALDQRRRAELVRSARGTIAETGHDWDRDPAAWVRAQRRAQGRRVG
jgi:metal-responsive CopG/Arc/MetJ family transcriptional regulator